MIVGACGFGATGSSVVTDYLREYKDIIVQDSLEFSWIYGTDGLVDLERAVMHPHSRAADSIRAIQRFEENVNRKAHSYSRLGLTADVFKRLSEEFINDITTVKWYTYDSTVQYRYRSKYFFHTVMKKKIIPRTEKKLGHYVNYWPLKEVRASFAPSNFYDAAQKYVDSLLQEMGMDPNHIFAMDQPFSGNNPQACFPFFRDPYAIVVDRDPRDNYVFARTKLLGKFHYIPINSVDDYIAYYRGLRKEQPYLQDHPRILRLHFEDFIYKYDMTTDRLREFLHLPKNPNPKSVFDPNLSKANTQVFLRFSQFEEDVKKIENELPEYLYDFSDCPKPEKNARMFYGKSPLNTSKHWSEKK